MYSFQPGATPTNPLAPTDQRAGVCPIFFMLDNGGQLEDPVFLNIRPEDLTRTEPSRSTLHQTLGRDQGGWVDQFGKGLPSVTIAGHTGWRYSNMSGMDGAEAFDALNDLVAHRYHEAKQTAVNQGLDPGEVNLIFGDLLHGTVWSVVPTTFVLRRSRSRSLLRQYNISLQAKSTSVGNTAVTMPNLGNPANGMIALDSAILTIASLMPDIIADLGAIIGEFTQPVIDFMEAAINILAEAQQRLLATKRALAGALSPLYHLADDMATVGVYVFRTLAAAEGVGDVIKASLIRAAAGLQEIRCIFANSLSLRQTYEVYADVYGASNCSSTTGGAPISPLAGQNVLAMTAPTPSPVEVSSAASASISRMKAADPILAPMSAAEMARHLSTIAGGVALA